MKRIHAKCMIVLGTMLLAAALFLVLYNLHTDQQSGAASVEILRELKGEIPEYVPTETLTESITPTEDLYAQYEEETTETQEPTDPPIELNGSLYAGVLTIPALNTELPVMQEWSYANLRLAPCRYAGSAAAGNLVIAAHNFSSHFGNIQSLNTGDTILFTDGTGNTHSYEVIQTEMIGGSDVQAMHDGAEEWDLTLFTCTLSGRSRVTVRAVEAVQ